MNKVEAIRNYNEMFAEMVANNPRLMSDVVSYRCGFCDYVDNLYRDGVITEKQADSWSVTIETVKGLKRTFSKYAQ